MAEENYTLDIGPVIAVLRSLICEDPPPPFKPGEAGELVAKLKVMFEAWQIDPSAPNKIFQEIGLQTLALLSERVSTHRLAERSIRRAQDGGEECQGD